MHSLALGTGKDAKKEQKKIEFVLLPFFAHFAALRETVCFST